MALIVCMIAVDLITDEWKGGTTWGLEGAQIPYIDAPGGLHDTERRN